MRLFKLRTWQTRNLGCALHILVTLGMVSVYIASCLIPHGTDKRKSETAYEATVVRPLRLHTDSKLRGLTTRTQLRNATKSALKILKNSKEKETGKTKTARQENLKTTTVITQSLEFKRYITLRKSRVNPNSHAFLISGKKICKDPPYLLILCLSKHLHVEERATIRQTWGNWSNDKKMSELSTLTSMKVVFMLGSSGNLTDSMTKLALLEGKQFGDIVMMNFTDTYQNLTKKVLMSLKWTFKYCKKAQFIFKVDEDTFVHVANLMNFLKILTIPNNGIIIGHGEFEHKVLRSGLWKLNTSEYPLQQYPPYVSGNSYVISGNIIRRMFVTAEYLPYIHIEDVFITGILREAVGADLIHKAGFTWWTERSPRLCGFHNTERISATNTDTFLMKKIWHALHLNLTNCYDPTTLRKLEYVTP